MKKQALILFLLWILTLKSNGQELRISGPNNKTLVSYRIGDELLVRFNVKKSIVLGAVRTDTTLQISALGILKGINNDSIYVDEYSYANYILNGKHIFNNVAFESEFELLRIPNKIAVKDIGIIQIRKKKIIVNGNMIHEKDSFISGKMEIL